MRSPGSVRKFVFIPELTIFVILIVALLIRVWGLGDASIWIDESFTIITSALPLSTLWVTPYDPTPPLFFTVEKFILLFGDNEFLIRLPSVIFNVATIYVMYKAALLEVGLKGALAVAIILALSAPNIEYAQEARAYSLLGLMISLAFLGLVRLNRFINASDKGMTLRNFLRNGGFLYAIATLGALYTHNISVFFVLAVQVYFASLSIIERTAFHGMVKYWLLINSVILVFWIPWLWATIEISKTGVFSWLQHVGIEEALFTVRTVHGLRFITAGQPFVDMIVAFAILAGLYSLKEKPAMFALCFSILIASSLVIWLFGLIKPVFMVRTIVWGSLFSAFLLGITLSRMKTPFYFLALATLSIVSTKNVMAFREVNYTENDNWKDAVGFFQDHAKSTDAVVLCADFVKDAFSYYSDKSLLPKYRIYGWSRDKQILRAGRVSTTESRRPRILWKRPVVDIEMLHVENRLWIVRSHCKSEVVAEVVDRANDLGLEKRLQKHFKQVDVSLFEKVDK